MQQLLTVKVFILWGCLALNPKTCFPIVLDKGHYNKHKIKAIPSKIQALPNLIRLTKHDIKRSDGSQPSDRSYCHILNKSCSSRKSCSSCRKISCPKQTPSTKSSTNSAFRIPNSVFKIPPIPYSPSPPPPNPQYSSSRSKNSPRRPPPAYPTPRRCGSIFCA